MEIILHDMGLSLNSTMKSHEESENVVNTEGNVLMDKISNKSQHSLSSISNTNKPQNEIVTEDNCDKKSSHILLNRVRNKYLELKNKKYDKSSEDLKIISKQLHKFLKYVWTAREFSHYLCDLPSQLQNNLEAEAKELESIYLEIKATSNNIETIKAQTKAVQKEKKEMNEVLRKKADQEKLEMEMIIGIYDKQMLTRWETIQNCKSETIVANFLLDIQGRLQAMKHLQTLVCAKLYTMENQSQSTKENNLSKKDKKTNSRKMEKKNRGLKRYERVDFFMDDQDWNMQMDSQNTSSLSLISSHASSSDSLLDSESEDTINVALNVEMNSVLQALFGEQMPLSSSSVSDINNSTTNVVDVD